MKFGVRQAGFGFLGNSGEDGEELAALAAQGGF
jgi:hypothetical protein